MTPALAAVVAYLAGAVPFGYLTARARGVDIFAHGSGNIGATNVGRVLGRRFGVLVFALDFLKGALPAAAGRALDGGSGWLGVGCGLAAFAGHLYPVYLGFRGGKGVATGAGVAAALLPGPFALALAAWLAVAAATRTVSLASVLATAALVLARLAVPEPFAAGQLPPTLFALLAGGLVVVKHRSNLARLARGEENRLKDTPLMRDLGKAVHVLALGLWFGGAGFFSFGAAPRIFDSFKQVVETAPSDRTAGVPLAAGLDEQRRGELASALAGSAVGPVFPAFFTTQFVCGFLALVPAMGWMAAEPGRRVHRLRVRLLGLAWVAVLVGWPVSLKVSDLRLERFSADPAVAAAARADFAGWHLVSLALSAATTLLAGVCLALAARMPASEPPPVQ